MNEATMSQGGSGGSYVEPGVKPKAEPTEEPTTPTTDWDAELEELTSTETVTV